MASILQSTYAMFLPDMPSYAPTGGGLGLIEVFFPLSMGLYNRLVKYGNKHPTGSESVTAGAASSTFATFATIQNHHLKIFASHVTMFQSSFCVHWVFGCSGVQARKYNPRYRRVSDGVALPSCQELLERSSALLSQASDPTVLDLKCRPHIREMVCYGRNILHPYTVLSILSPTYY